MKPENKKHLIDEIKYKVDKNMKSHANDPFILKKAAESKAFLDKHGFPQELVNRRKSEELRLQKPSD